MIKKYQVFVSSTYSDLKDERKKVFDTLLKAGCIPSGMEAFVASDNEQFEVIKKVISLCDYYVLILGKRYGSINKKTSKSYTEMEYDYAKSIGIPVLVFAINESVELANDKSEQDKNKVNLLSCFREKVLENRLVFIWSSLDELTSTVALSILQAINENIRPGWIRGTDYNEDSIEIIKKQEIRIKELEQEISYIKNEKNINFSNELTEQLNLQIKIEYTYDSGTYRNPIKSTRMKEVKLYDLFLLIAIEMLDVSITEEHIKRTIIENIIGSNIYNSINDKQLIKKLLSKLKILGLLDSKWNEGNKSLYWFLTKNGQMLKNEVNLLG